MAFTAFRPVVSRLALSPILGVVSLRPGGPIRCEASKHYSGQWLNMGMSRKVKLTNSTPIEVKVKEINTGVELLMAHLKPNQSIILKSDPTATFREFVLVTLPDNTDLKVFNTDHVQEFKEIVIKKREGDGLPKYYWEGIPATVNSAKPDPEKNDATEPGFFGKLFPGFHSRAKL